MKLFISGLESNTAAFSLAAIRLRDGGFDVFNPTEFPNAAHKPDPKADWRFLLKRSITALLGCDALVQLDGWWDSKSAGLQFEVASALGLPIYSFNDKTMELMLSKPGLP